MNMKKYLLILCALAVAVSCVKDDKFLEEHSYTYDDNSFYTSESDMIMALTPCYANMEYLMMGQTHGNHSWMLQGMGLDTFSNTDANAKAFGNWPGLNADSGFARHWFDELYRMINRCNTVIDMIDERESIEYSTETMKNELRAEAVLLRAWAYRNLAGMFGNVVILDHRTSEAKYDYEPNTRQQVWEFVENDLKWAEQNLPKTPRLQGTVTKAVAAHYLAEVEIALGKFQDAIDAATRVINKTDGDYEIMRTRFGNRAADAVDRYGNSLAAPQGAYWDLFRGSVKSDGSVAADANPNSPDNKEAIWVAQYNYGTFRAGGGGDAWWRVLCCTTEANWTPGILLGSQTARTRKSNDKSFYVYGDNVACYPEGVKVGTDSSAVPGCELRQLAKVRQDSLGARVDRIGTNCIPVEYVYRYSSDPLGGLWDDPNDFRGSETMIQRNFFTAGGTRWFDEKAKMYARAAAAVGTVDESVCAVLASDTTAIFPRFWKFSEDKHPNFETDGNKGYDVDWYMIRIPETYLLRAEAYLALGKTSEAAADINVVRSRAGAKPCSAGDVDIDYILDERTRELLGEEHRWITLNRLSCNPNCGSYVTSKYPTQDFTTSNTMYERVHKYGFGFENNPGSRESYTDVYGKTRHRSNFAPHNIYWPIPTQVLQANTGFDYPQNPGY